MKKHLMNTLYPILLSFFFIPSGVSAAALFVDDFESDLSLWTGRGGSVHNGVIVADPLNAGNNVLTFSNTVTGGDIFTAAQFNLSAGQQYQISFDYLGLAQTGSVANDFGGFAGMAADIWGDAAIWYYGTSTGSNASDVLIDDGVWRNYTYNFTAPISFDEGVVGNDLYLMFEDATGVAGDVYFDNIQLQAVPVPAALYLFVSGLLGFGLLARKRSH